MTLEPARAGKAPRKAWTVCITSFDEEGNIDEAAFRAHLRRLVEAGQSIYVGSTNVGEGFALSETEQGDLLSIAADELRDKAALRAAGFEARSVAEARRTIRVAEKAGVGAVHLFQLDTGHGSTKPDEAELERYYTQVLGSASIPVVLSNYPSLGYSVPLPLMGRLLDRFPQIVAIRDASGDIGHFSELVSRFGGRAELYAVGAKNVLTSLMLGADAVFTTEANVAPRLVVDLLRAFERDDLAAVRSAFGKLVRLHRLLAKYGSSAGRGMKPLLNHLGLPGGALRSPRIGISAVECEALLSAIRSLELPELNMAH